MAEGSDEVRNDNQDEEAPQQHPDASEGLRERAQEGDEVAQARANVEQTREEMGETVDALQGKVGPQAMKEQATTSARNAYSGLIETIKNNPTPAAISGGVLALVVLRRLVAGGKSSGRDSGSSGLLIEPGKGGGRRARGSRR